MKVRKLLVLLLALGLVAAFMAAGCGGGAEEEETTKGPESVTAFQAAELTRSAAKKWQSNSWIIQMRDGDSTGVDKEGKSKIWEVYYFCPDLEQSNVMMIIYNRGNVWPNAPSTNRGGDKGREAYQKNKPPAFRVDSGEAYTVSLRNGGGVFVDTHKDALAHVLLRCKADYEAIGETMPAPKYTWIWQVAYRQPVVGTDVLFVYVDGMNGDFITKQEKKGSK